MSDSYAITFQVLVPGGLARNQQLVLLGSSRELGGWDARKNRGLHNTGQHWEVTVHMPRGNQVEYKMAVISGQEVRWELAPLQNRKLNLARANTHHDSATVRLLLNQASEDITWYHGPPVICCRPGCTRKSYNNSQGEYCCRGCKASMVPLFCPLPLNIDSFADTSLLAFYYPGEEDACDVVCGAGFLGNFYDLHACNATIRLPFDRNFYEFRTAEGAYQAFKFPEQAHEFQSMTGSEAFQHSRRLAQRNPVGGRASPELTWLFMNTVLDEKFRAHSPLAEALQATGQTLLLEHNPKIGRDVHWSDNGDGSGMNRLGMLLMIVRDRLNRIDSYDAQLWSCFFQTHVDLNTGYPKTDAWPTIVKQATHNLCKFLATK